MTLYIAGPMTGYPDENRPAFVEAEKLLLERGYDVVNPAPYDEPGWRWRDYLARDLKLVIECDGVAVLPGWECSKGACLEVYVAQSLEMPVRPVERWL